MKALFRWWLRSPCFTSSNAWLANNPDLTLTTDRLGLRVQVLDKPLGTLHSIASMSVSESSLSLGSLPLQQVEGPLHQQAKLVYLSLLRSSEALFPLVRARVFHLE